MKKIINIFLGVAVVLAVQSCKTDTELSKTLDNTTSGTALRGLNEVNSLDLRNPSSTWSLLIEVDDEEMGDATEEVRVLLGFTDDAGVNSVAPALWQTFPISSFTVQNTQTTHDLPEQTFTFTLQEMVSALGLASTDYDRDDIININFEAVRTDGRVFNSANVGANTGSAGAFSFFKSQFDYPALIDDPSTVLLTGNSVDNEVVRGGAPDSVFLTFDAALVTLPTVTPSAAVGADGTVGTVTQKSGGDYFFLYTPDGGEDADTVSFTIAGGESTAGLPMVTRTLSDAYIVDNVVPTVTNTSSSMSAGSTVDRITLGFAFSEELFGTVTYTITADGDEFEEVELTTSEDEAETAIITFTPEDEDGDPIARQQLTFTVVVSGTAGSNGVDIGGNPVDQTFNITLF